MTSSPLMTMAEVGVKLRFKGKRPDISARRWLLRHDVLLRRRDKCWLVREADIEAVLNQYATGDTEGRARAMGQRA